MAYFKLRIFQAIHLRNIKFPSRILKKVIKIISPRKTKILELIIESYIETAEPIASRTVAQKCNLGISPATIRNEMSDLEEMGYIIQPHTSAGRIPSDKGYRLYVDNLMKHKKLTASETDFLKKIILQNINQVDFLIKETVRAISMLTNYTTIMTQPVITENRIKFVKLIPIDANALILVVVKNDNTSKSSTINIELPDNLDFIACKINENLCGLDISDIDFEVSNKILCEVGAGNSQLLYEILAAIKSDNNVEYYTSGIKNILAYPEFRNLDKAKNIFEAFDEKNFLSSIFANDLSGNIKITIGNENENSLLKDCSLIKTNCSLGKKTSTGIGIIGPTRMDYSQVISVLSEIERFISEIN